MNKDLFERVLRFAKYCNGLTPYKLEEPLDPIIQGVLEDFTKDLQSETKKAELRGGIERLKKVKSAIYDKGSIDEVAEASRSLGIIDKELAELQVEVNDD